MARPPWSGPSAASSASVLVVDPAGAGKTTLGQAARLLADQGRRALGLAPSGKAADVLAVETAWPATTLAKLLHDHGGRGGPTPSSTAGAWSAWATPGQLPAVGRGGMFELWCERLPTYQLDEVRRFGDDRQAEASLIVRRGHPAAAAAYGAPHRVRTVHPVLAADRVARQFERLAARGQSVAISTASAGTARAINVEIQRRRNPRGDGARAGDRPAPPASALDAARRSMASAIPHRQPQRTTVGCRYRPMIFGARGWHGDASPSAKRARADPGSPAVSRRAGKI